MRKVALVLVVIGLLITTFFVFNNLSTSQNQTSDKSESIANVQEIRYIPIGDSYTIGLGVDPEGRWPNILVKNLRANGVNIRLTTNPSVSGYTVQDAIDRELPVIQKEKPDLVTILIGANDNFANGDINVYRKELGFLIGNVQKNLTGKDRLVLITLPDYSKSPTGTRYGGTRNISESVRQYNDVIKDEAKKRNLKVADLFPLSQTMTSTDLYIDDGLHPSAKGYAMWEKEIYPKVYELLSE